MARAAVLTIGLGFLVRLFGFLNTSIISPDGVLFIQQARAIFYGSHDTLAANPLTYVSNYPIFIAGAYAVIRNWVAAAKAVSLLFGTLTLVPLFFLAKRFLEEKIAVLVTLIFALMPFLVDRSVDAVREPVFWFFLVLGVYFFVKQIGLSRHLYLFLSSLSFLFAAWARIEGVLFIGISFLFMFIVREERKVAKVAVFSIPIALLLLIFVLRVSIFNLNIDGLYHFQRIMPGHFGLIGAQYDQIRGATKDLAYRDLGSIVSRFLLEARHLVWWIGLGILAKSIVKSLFYVFIVPFLLGFKGLWARLKQDRRVLYVSLLTFSAFIFLYIVVLVLWEMYCRYVGIFVFASLVFIGFGLESIIELAKTRLRLRESIAFGIMCLLILGLSLPKNLKYREADKLVFKQIGTLIAEKEGNQKETRIVTSTHLIRWISFYANLKYKGAPSPESNYDLENIIGSTYKEFLQNLRNREISFILWEEKHWPKVSISYLTGLDSNDFIEIGTWSHPDTGKLVLFEVL